MSTGPEYAELAVTTNFSFLHGASHPDELVLTAAALGVKAIAIADRNTLAGVVRAHKEAKNHDLQIIIGCRLVMVDGFEIICLPTNKAAYSRLTRLLSQGNLRAEKGNCHLTLDDVQMHAKDQILIIMPPETLGEEFKQQVADFASRFKDGHLALTRYYGPHDHKYLEALSALARDRDLLPVATNNILYHIPDRRPLQDVLTCIRNHTTVQKAGLSLRANAERHLKTPYEIYRLFPGFPDAVARSVEIARKCRFSLDELAYQYPDEPCGDSSSPQAELERLTWIGAEERYPDGIPEKVRNILTHELSLIGGLNYAPYFLTVYDIVRFARSLTPPILCQGRGSAANSAVCYCLGVTSVNPTEVDLLFERFVSAERDEPPDIDVDFEHERREEVIQYIYNRYGRHRAGLAATVVTYRTRSAVREVGKAMGLSEDVVAALASNVWGHSSTGLSWEDAARIGIGKGDKTVSQTLQLSQMLIGFPRHLSQHVGGFVITRDPLIDLSPISNAAMENRTVVEWDKDDLDALGILKIDVLSLGMLTCIRKAFDLLEDHYHYPMSLAGIPRDDAPTYDMIQKADTVGVFQIESRAQMSMLPRLRPENFYDLVIEIAIVRPGPIQGDMVHPYLRRRQGLEEVTYPSEELRSVLEKTKGVPLFQEQAMQIAMVGAGFTAEEADGLRRAMATFKRTGDIGNFKEKFLNGMTSRGYEPEFADQCFRQIEGFSDYGFPESHSASFALLAYASAWLKCHYPDVFCAAILNSQPMGFYSAASLVRDFREHGGTVLAADINFSHWDNMLEPSEEETGVHIPVRLGFRQISGFRAEEAGKLLVARLDGFDSIRDLYFRAGLEMRSLELLAGADAFRSIGLDRREALWAVKGLSGQGKGRAAPEDLPLFASARAEKEALQKEAEMRLPSMPLGQHVVEDYATLRLSLKAHPISFLRDSLRPKGVITTENLQRVKNGQRVNVAGLILARQRPGTAAGVIFMTLEDETGTANVIVWPKKFEIYRRVVLSARVVRIEGEIQTEQNVIHLITHHMEDLSHRLSELMEEAPEKPTIKQETMKPNLWRHPRTTQVMPKGRNFH
ncbi:DNA polymerase III subunit alpha [Sneathiella sp. P13V-1]|uniref:error-prone DNA polymerase n=1 Tax=Sneathiella sp. P13V-1 TaxID=2697366 RepID=UPI00187BAA05|nr:error-prone DNA polymerase [Sneathiella sp. P13V-1]MBE7638664.1 DNA polymerase III subunit alpha [Sneathiella sp. P13V-1]